jgi:hypothetical protein
MCSGYSLHLHVDGKGGMAVDNKTAAKSVWASNNKFLCVDVYIIMALPNTTAKKRGPLPTQHMHQQGHICIQPVVYNTLYFICIAQFI